MPCPVALDGFKHHLQGLNFMAGQRTPPNVPPPEIRPAIKGLLTIDFP